MREKTIITCALTGSGDTRSKNPHVPVTPQEIAADAIAAADAGAAIVHVHVRDPATGRESRDPSLFREVVERVRASRSDVLLNLTTAVGVEVYFDLDNPSRLTAATDFQPPETRLRHVRENRPDICSLDLCNMLYGGEPYLNLPAHIRHIARVALELGVKPELEVFNPGDLVLARELAAEGQFAEPAWVQIVLGVRYGAPATVRSLQCMIELMPPGAQWGAFAVGTNEFPMLAQSVLLGGHVRVGLEDNLYLARGVPASNQLLVERAVRIVRDLGSEPATASEARAILGLAGP